MKEHLSNDVFMSELTLMFHHARDKGTVTLSIKRYDGRKVPIPKTRTKKGKVVKTAEPLPEPETYSCLLRARHRSKTISSVVKATEVVKYQAQFAQFLRSSMDGLRKEKKPRKRVKSKKATQ
ncbi:Signal recognition particle SRP14 subunit [Trinorchestia longiramus]|nr:Signal recognition particle SRP14 subunit [Trinorchestia longiramus]